MFRSSAEAGKGQLSIATRIGSLVVGAAFLAGCSSAPTTASVDDGNLPFTEIPRPEVVQELADRVPEEIRDKGHLSVALDIYPTAVISPPEGGDLRGWEVSTAQALGAVLDLDLKFEKTSFDSMLPGLVSGRYDVVMSSWAATPARTEEVTFVIAHSTDISMLVRDDSDLTADSLLDLCGQRLGLIAGSIQVPEYETIYQPGCVEAGLPGIELQTFKTINEAVLALEADRIDVQISATDMHVYLMSQQPDTFKSIYRFDSPTLASVHEDVRPGSSGIALARESDYWEELAEVLKDALNVIIEDGTHQAILDKWNSGFGGVEEAIIVP
jgi:polar amino acid transport system substrate-binding protein